MKKKKLKFHVRLSIQELSSIPLLNGVLYCKTRLLNGGDFCAITGRGNVTSNQVKWGQRFDFATKINTSQTTGVLETCICRISVRKEVKGGKHHEKLGYVDVNLAQYAGCGEVDRRYILEGYKESKQHRQDNSILTITANMTLTSGDPLFKRQESNSDHNLQCDSHTTFAPTPSEAQQVESDHQRNSSSGNSKIQARISSVDKRSSSASSHTRQASNISGGDSGCADLDTYHISPLPTRPKRIHKKIDETRVDADDIVDRLMQGANLTMESGRADEGIDMSLFLEKDGVSTMSKIETKRRPKRPIEDRFKTL